MNISKEIRTNWVKHFKNLIKNGTPMIEAMEKVKETALKTWKGSAEGFEVQWEMAFKNQQKPQKPTITVAQAYEMIEKADIDCIGEVMQELNTLGFKFFHKASNEPLEYVKTENEKEGYYCMKFVQKDGKKRESYTHCIKRFIVISND